MENKTCHNCGNHFYKDVLKCASCYELSNWEPKNEEENNDAQTICGK